jgi:hypothetical protein
LELYAAFNHWFEGDVLDRIGLRWRSILDGLIEADKSGIFACLHNA